MIKPLQEYDFFRRLSDLPFVEKIILYGSRARGDHAERSDIDIALVCPRATDNDWFNVLGIVDQADTLLKIDCVRLDALSLESSLRKSIESQGIIAYQRKLNE